jgi:hypothetical protein
MMSQREQGVEEAGEEVGRSGPAETCRQRRTGDGMGADARRRSVASGFYREAVSFNGRLIDDRRSTRGNRFATMKEPQIKNS